MMPTMYPYLSYRDAASALRFLEEAFGFTTNVRWDAPDGTVQHAEATFGDGALMMGTAEHPTAPLEGASVGQGTYSTLRTWTRTSSGQGRQGLGWCTRRRTPSGGRAAIGCSTLKATSGVSAPTGPAANPRRSGPRQRGGYRARPHAASPSNDRGCGLRLIVLLAVLLVSRRAVT